MPMEPLIVEISHPSRHFSGSSDAAMRRPARSHVPTGSHARRTDCGRVPCSCCERSAVREQLGDPVHAVLGSEQLVPAVPDRLLHV